MPASTSGPASATGGGGSSSSTANLGVTKDFSTNKEYWSKYVQPYVADRDEGYQFDPLHVPERDNFDLKWRLVNREPYILKKYGKFPRPAKEKTIDDVRMEVGVAPLISPPSRGKLSPRGGESRQTSPTPKPKAANYENQKPGPEIYKEKLATSTSATTLTNFELAQMRLKDDTYYVPPGSKFQAPHPMSNTRSGFRDDPAVDMKRVMALRKQGGAVVPTSRSLTNLPLASNPMATEFGSVKQLHKCRNKHMRSLAAPCEIFEGKMMQASQAIGWAQDDPSVKPHMPKCLKYKGPDHGIMVHAQHEGHEYGSDFAIRRLGFVMAEHITVASEPCNTGLEIVEAFSSVVVLEDYESVCSQKINVL
ncbi:unnamed protein product [Amoebophrya sp. A25]|nr:unnamed protein product [Amoebophrya sp. A25]|eukprot:GSA25T00010332001.1